MYLVVGITEIGEVRPYVASQFLEIAYAACCLSSACPTVFFYVGQKISGRRSATTAVKLESSANRRYSARAQGTTISGEINFLRKVKK
jgi:hypothetical protein